MYPTKRQLCYVLTLLLACFLSAYAESPIVDDQPHSPLKITISQPWVAPWIAKRYFLDLKNTSTRPVIAYSVALVHSNAGTEVLRFERNFGFADPPGSSILLAPGAQVTAIDDLTDKDSRLEKVSIDYVLLDDGTSFGPDKSNTYLQYGSAVLASLHEDKAASSSTPNNPVVYRWAFDLRSSLVFLCLFIVSAAVSIALASHLGGWGTESDGSKGVKEILLLCIVSCPLAWLSFYGLGFRPLASLVISLAAWLPLVSAIGIHLSNVDRLKEENRIKGGSYLLVLSLSTASAIAFVATISDTRRWHLAAGAIICSWLLTAFMIGIVSFLSRVDLGENPKPKEIPWGKFAPGWEVIVGGRRGPATYEDVSRFGPQPGPWGEILGEWMGLFFWLLPSLAPGTIAIIWLNAKGFGQPILIYAAIVTIVGPTLARFAAWITKTK